LLTCWAVLFLFLWVCLLHILSIPKILVAVVLVAVVLVAVVLIAVVLVAAVLVTVVLVAVVLGDVQDVGRGTLDGSVIVIFTSVPIVER